MLARPAVIAAECDPAAVVTVASPGGSAKVTGRVSKALRFDPATVAPCESVSSEAVRVEVPSGPRTWDGLAVAASVRYDGACTAPLVVSHPVVPGPVLQPHQLSAASTDPVVVTVPAPTLPVIRSRCSVAVPCE